ncbi:MAG: hypothetical protein ACI9TV_002786 [Sulfurimonas sp.]|jgi:hypothetical protein|uniref:Lcl C-terminal domain-containing protein n=1 Tax=Sulfurimonas sp. TaxID=2022749 RepID=UPI0039E307D4
MKKLLLTLSAIGSLYAVDVTFDSGTSLMWQDNKDVRKSDYTFAQAQSYCSNLKLGEYSDFRVPTLRELQTIIDYRNHNPAMLNGFKNPESDEFWSSTPFVYRTDSLWIVDFKKGTTETASERYSKNVRCVQHIK